VDQAAPFPDSGMEFTLEKDKPAKAKVEKGKITIDGSAFTYAVQPPDAKVLFQPILGKNGTALDQSLVVFVHPGGDTRGKYSISLEEMKKISASRTEKNYDVTVEIKKV